MKKLYRLVVDIDPIIYCGFSDDTVLHFLYNVIKKKYVTNKLTKTLINFLKSQHIAFRYIYVHNIYVVCLSECAYPNCNIKFLNFFPKTNALCHKHNTIPAFNPHSKFDEFYK